MDRRMPLYRFVDRYAMLLPNKIENAILYCAYGTHSGQVAQFILYT